MRTSEVRLRKIEDRMRRDQPPMSEAEQDAMLDEILGKVGLSYKVLLEKFGNPGGILRAIATHYGSVDRFARGEPPISERGLSARIPLE